MKRIAINARPDWTKKVEDIGFDFHTIDGKLYWDESVYYKFATDQINILERAGNECHEMCLKAVQYVIDNKLYGRLGIAEEHIPLIEKSWNEDHMHFYGRFDFSWDGNGNPKMLEYNADTPTSLFEASVVQWHWKTDRFAHKDQFNSIHEKLVGRWDSVCNTKQMHFASCDRNVEDECTVKYLAETAAEAGKDAVVLCMNDIGINPGSDYFVDANDDEIHSIFKLYPWEWMLNEEFGAKVKEMKTQWVEPTWKMIISNKGILPILWEMFPTSQWLLPAYTSPEKLNGSYVKKPLLSREGANIVIVKNNETLSVSDGDYGEEGYIYQALAELPSFDGNFPVLGVWMVGCECAGMGIRECNSLITDNLSRFIPHIFE